MMKIEDFDRVAELMEQRKRINEAIADVKEYRDDIRLKEGYYGCFAKYSDGSGDRISLEGCCVEHEVLQAIDEVLHEKYNSIIADLQKLGVF